MTTNPVLKKLGYSKLDRVVIIHTDDIGMCQASVTAFEELWDYGLISSGATMVPCSWFPAAARLCRNNPKIDLGVHLTLTSEWSGYRWGPISTRKQESGLVDMEGYFYASSEEAQTYGDPDAVAMEIKAQVERALTSGIDVTHIDTHMGTVASLKYIPSYLSLASQFRIPVMIMRFDKEDWIKMGLDEATADMAVQMISRLEEQGIPLIDRISSLDLDRAKTMDERIAYAKDVFTALKPGITHFIIHPSKDTPELRAITPDWKCRVADFMAFQSDILRDYLADQGIQVIGYRVIKELM